MGRDIRRTEEENDAEQEADRPVADFQSADEVPHFPRFFGQDGVPGHLTTHCRTETEIQNPCDARQHDGEPDQTVGLNPHPLYVYRGTGKPDEGYTTRAGEIGEQIGSE